MSRNILKTIKLLVYCTVTIINNCVIEAKFSFPLPPPLSWESGLSVLFKGSAAVSPLLFWLAKPSQSRPLIGQKSCVKTLQHCVFLAQFDYYYCRVTFQHGAKIIFRNWSQINNNTTNIWILMNVYCSMLVKISPVWAQVQFRVLRRDCKNRWNEHRRRETNVGWQGNAK